MARYAHSRVVPPPRDIPGAQPSTQPSTQPAAQSPHPARWGWAALTCYFPLLLWLIPSRSGTGGLALRVALFHGVGVVWSSLLLRREGRLGAVLRLAARPGQGLLWGMLGFAVLAGAATLLLRLPSGSLPCWLPELLHPLDLSPLPKDPRLPRDAGSAFRLLLAMSGGMAEEWIFRCAFWLRWAGPFPQAGQAPPSPTLRRACKLLLISAYFSLLHWPHGRPMMLQAFSGSILLGLVLWRWRSFWTVAVLHALFNWNTF